MIKRFELTADANTDEILLIIDHQDKVMWSFLKDHEEAVKGVYDRLTQQDKRIYELESQLEFWKGSAGVCQGELSIVNNELGIALEQGYKLSDAYMEYKEDKEKEVVNDD